MPDLSPTSRPTLHTQAFLLSALAAVFWGTNFEATRIVLAESPPWTAAALRFVVAAGAALLWLWATRGITFAVLRRNAVAFVLLGLIGVAGFNAALFLGMKTSSPVTAALIMGTSPLTTNLLEALFNRRRPAGLALAGMGISLVGVALTVGAFSGARFAPGDLLIAGGSLAWALYSIGCRRWVKGAAPLETTVWTMVFGTAALAGIAVVLENPLQVMADASPVFWLVSLHMALVGSVLAFVFWQIGIARRGPAATSILFNLVPVSALVVAAGFGRIPDWSQVLGVGVAIFGVWLASRPQRKPLVPVLATQSA
ncbi:DMT family transporter [Pararhodospirillum oryzae]|uniref:Putative transporter YyaM n=1 Tax=Pararhodospirillum oryzae TaxID=478448 RepID=A0A512H6N3_9PROT|nr:DMT family transporter [Pararhodospirillum oryzae]GEO81126.1 putative transporter YyaM [Pararhodospirillum oryzae]